MGEGTGLDSMKNHPNTFPKHVGVGFGWSHDIQQDFHQFHDLNTATHSAHWDTQVTLGGGSEIWILVAQKTTSVTPLPGR